MKMLRRQFVLWSGFLITTGLAFAQTSKIAPDLELLAPTNVLIQYNGAPNLLNITKLMSLGGTINAQ